MNMSVQQPSSSGLSRGSIPLSVLNHDAGGQVVGMDPCDRHRDDACARGKPQ
jgi:hypothetical protein